MTTVWQRISPLGDPNSSNSVVGKKLADHIQCLKDQTSDLPPSQIGLRTFTNRDEWMFPHGGPVP